MVTPIASSLTTGWSFQGNCRITFNTRIFYNTGIFVNIFLYIIVLRAISQYVPALKKIPLSLIDPHVCSNKPFRPHMPGKLAPHGKLQSPFIMF